MAPRGKKSDFEMGPGTRFDFQHDARRLSDGTISIFDNGSLVFEDGIPKAVEESCAIVLELDEREMKASLVREYTHPDGQYADAAGNAQVLPNGNVFVGWGRALAISEFAHDGGLVFDARLPPRNRSYRAFRFPWRGYPTDRPAAAAERASEEEVKVYASWNGATEVATWEVLTGPRPDGLEPLGSVARDGFETAILARSAEPYVAVQAKDAPEGYSAPPSPSSREAKRSHPASAAFPPSCPYTPEFVEKRSKKSLGGVSRVKLLAYRSEMSPLRAVS